MDDAHNHLQDAKLHGARDSFSTWMRDSGIHRMIVNGTRQSDWHDVASLAESHPTIIRPAYGLHPWWISERTESWQTELEHLLETTPNASIGECGLDRWINDHDIDDQLTVFGVHLDLAEKFKLPVTIHCLKAWGHLVETLSDRPPLPRGFIVHAFSGSLETAKQLIDLGAYFSFSGYFLHERKHTVREVYRQLPIDRILIETDAPSMPLPKDKRIVHLPDDDDGKPVNHPANLVAVRDALAKLRDLQPEVLDEQLEANFSQHFGD